MPASSSSDLAERHCEPCTGEEEPMDTAEARRSLALLPDGWDLVADDRAIEKTFEFDSYRAVVDFVNAVADIAEAEGHHPDLGVHYDRVEVRIQTHAIGGLSENDFILAAKIEQ